MSFFEAWASSNNYILSRTYYVLIVLTGSEHLVEIEKMARLFWLAISLIFLQEAFLGLE
jgi:hypothetical protein